MKRGVKLTPRPTHPLHPCRKMWMTKKNRQAAGLPGFFPAWNLVFGVSLKFEVNSLSAYWNITVSSRRTDVSNLNAYYFFRFLNNISCTDCFLTKFRPNKYCFIHNDYDSSFFLNDDIIINFGWIITLWEHCFQKWPHFSKKNSKMKDLFDSLSLKTAFSKLSRNVTTC